MCLPIRMSAARRSEKSGLHCCSQHKLRTMILDISRHGAARVSCISLTDLWMGCRTIISLVIVIFLVTYSTRTIYHGDISHQITQISSYFHTSSLSLPLHRITLHAWFLIDDENWWDFTWCLRCENLHDLNEIPRSTINSQFSIFTNNHHERGKKSEPRYSIRLIFGITAISSGVFNRRSFTHAKSLIHFAESFHILTNFINARFST